MIEKLKQQTLFTTAGAVFAGSLVAASTATTPAGAQQQPPQNGWFKVCSKQEDTDICNVQFQAIASNGQVVTSVNLAEISGKVNRRVFQITVPTGRLIPAGVKLRIDDKQETSIPYVFCFQNRCAAEVKLDDKLVGLLKAGGKLTITSVNFQNKANPIEVTLEGFTSAYDGEPMKEDELASRQQQLQEELRKKAEEARKKLQEAQDAAKTQ